MTITPPLINVMIQSARKASRALVRDFHEVNKIRSSDGIGKFMGNAQSHLRKMIYNDLCDYNQDYGFLFEEEIAVKPLLELARKSGKQECIDEDLNHISTNSEKDCTWFISVLDSKVNFINANPYFALSISLIYKEKKKEEVIVAAVVDAPLLQETFWAGEGQGAFIEDPQSNHMRMRINGKQSLKGAYVDCYNINGNIHDKLLSNGLQMRSMGSVLLSFAYLAAGRFDALVCSNIHKYKAAIGKLFLQESNGIISTDNNNLLVASNLTLHNSLVKELSKASSTQS